MTDDVLIAEVPKQENRNGPSRWSQCNFPKRIIQNYFGVPAQPGTGKHITLHHLTDGGTLEPSKDRPFVSVVSKNHRFELGAGAKKPYPSGADRPIVVLVRKGLDDYWHQVLMPDHTRYAVLSGYLKSAYKGPKRQLRRVISSVDQLKKLWPDAPLLK